MSDSKDYLENLNEGFGYNANSYGGNSGAFSGKMIQHNAKQEPVQTGPNTNTPPPHPADELLKQMTQTDAVDMRHMCPSCSKFAEECTCKGSCGNCGGTNGECDCSMNQDFALGDMIRAIDPDCDCIGSTGRIIDLPSPNSVTYIIIKPAGGRTPGEIVNKPMNMLTIDEKYKL